MCSALTIHYIVTEFSGEVILKLLLKVLNAVFRLNYIV